MPTDPVVTALLGFDPEAIPGGCDNLDDLAATLAAHYDTDPCPTPGCRFAVDADPLAAPCDDCADAGGWF
jgi:hypothetical protein